MPRIEATAAVPVPPDVAFAVSQSQAALRYRWDPFVKEQRLLDGAVRPAKGVRTFTRSRHRLTMVSEYLAFNPPRQVGMRMVTGPWFFRTFSAGWGFAARPDGGTDATWRYSFAVRPGWLRVVADPIGTRLLQRDIERRIAGYAAACADEALVADIVARDRELAAMDGPAVAVGRPDPVTPSSPDPVTPSSPDPVTPSS